jgi:hypothetical protein
VLAQASGGIAAASTASSAVRIVPGATWTAVSIPVNSCDDITFGAAHTWTGGGGTNGNDSGTYRGGGRTVLVRWKTGILAAEKLVFTGTYSASLPGYFSPGYAGTFTYTGGSNPGALLPGTEC